MLLAGGGCKFRPDGSKHPPLNGTSWRANFDKLARPVVTTFGRGGDGSGPVALRQI